MHHRVEALLGEERGARPVADVAFTSGRTAGQVGGDVAALERRVVEVVEVVEHDDAIAARERRLAQVRADEARAARDENSRA